MLMTCRVTCTSSLKRGRGEAQESNNLLVTRYFSPQPDPHGTCVVCTIRALHYNFVAWRFLYPLQSCTLSLLKLGAGWRAGHAEGEGGQARLAAGGGGGPWGASLPWGGGGGATLPATLQKIKGCTLSLFLKLEGLRVGLRPLPRSSKEGLCPRFPRAPHLPARTRWGSGPFGRPPQDPG